MHNEKIADVFRTIAMILDLKDDENPFRKRAYERAVDVIGNASEEVQAVYERGGLDALEDLPGIGKELALKIEELLKTGSLAYLEKLKKEIPAGVFAIMAIEGMGPKRTKFVWKKFGVTDVAQLAALASSGSLDTEKGWGEKSVANVLRNIEHAKMSGGRLPLARAEVLARDIVKALKKSKLCTRIEVAGSLRRKKETVGDIDILVTTDRPEEVMNLFCGLPQVQAILGKGKTKSTVFLKAGLDADLRAVDDDVFGAALQYFTGNKDHNVKLRKLARKKGLTISEYGVHRGSAARKEKLVASRTEEDVYRSVGLRWIPPEERVGENEFERYGKA